MKTGATQTYSVAPTTAEAYIHTEKVELLSPSHQHLSYHRQHHPTPEFAARDFPGETPSRTTCRTNLNEFLTFGLTSIDTESTPEPHQSNNRVASPTLPSSPKLDQAVSPTLSPSSHRLGLPLDSSTTVMSGGS
uniref:Uncharacterized protein n=1 Tax=Cacopsylla melanoneura TaxID=428564 RepID=A0A8D9DZN0_9HEMI